MMNGLSTIIDRTVYSLSVHFYAKGQFKYFMTVRSLAVLLSIHFYFLLNLIIHFVKADQFVELTELTCLVERSRIFQVAPSA